MENFIPQMRTDLSGLNASVDKVKAEIGKVIVGQHSMIELLIAAILADGHVLIEGVPGVAKTLTAKLLAKTIDSGFSRIQFTPDLMPSDVLGTSVFNPQSGNFQFRRGPIFSNIVLIDEINRSPAKTQAALFEVMEERQITYDGSTYIMEKPFMVLATQNPVEHEGTYRLPEAQLDRFLFKIDVHYPALEEEIRILQNHQQSKNTQPTEQVQAVLTASEIEHYRSLVKDVHIEQKLIEYIARIVQETRNNKSLFLGASPRASVSLMNAAKALAAIRGRDFVTPDDVLEVVPPVLRHRIILTPEKEMEGITNDDVLHQIVAKIEVPR
ncbi:MAG: MoxR family ATPase [Sphingobacteriales bacterium]|nr:MoxR family ATPase [Sphingobacteriales bacterium]MBI3718549.1 MoxR family ATPase [Sphingobacteriales bacterium]